MDVSGVRLGLGSDWLCASSQRCGIETDPSFFGSLHLLFPLFVSLPLSGRKKKKTLALPVGPGWNFEGSRKHHCKTTQASIKWCKNIWGSVLSRFQKPVWQPDNQPGHQRATFKLLTNCSAIGPRQEFHDKTGAAGCGKLLDVVATSGSRGYEVWDSDDESEMYYTCIYIMYIDAHQLWVLKVKYRSIPW